MATGGVNVEYLADHLLAFPDVVPDVLDPPRRDLGDWDQTFASVILVQ